MDCGLILLLIGQTRLPGMQEYFALKVLALNKPTVLILCNGGAIAIDNLVAGPQGTLKANDGSFAVIIEAYNPSVMGANAIALSLFGLANRWGKLVATMYPHAFIKENPLVRSVTPMYCNR